MGIVEETEAKLAELRLRLPDLEGKANKVRPQGVNPRPSHLAIRLRRADVGVSLVALTACAARRLSASGPP
jgi:hypothetical protein